MKDLRCFCSRRPVLAKYGSDEKGRPYVHLKVHKQGRIYGEIVFTSGVVHIHCRECLRWYTVNIKVPYRGINVQEEPLPAEISV